MSAHTILEAVSFAAGRFLRSSDWTAEIDEVIRRLGEAAGVSRVRVFQCHRSQDGVPLVSERYEWTAPGVASQLDNPADLNVPWESAAFHRCAEALKRGTVLSGSVNDFTEEERPYLADQGILAMAMVPIRFDGDLWGILGFDDCAEKREWTPVEIDALQAAADIIGQSIHRGETEVALAQSEQRFRGLVEQSLVAISVESAGEIVFVNPACAEVLGAERPEQIVGQPLVRFVQDDSVGIVQEGMERVRGGASTHLADVQLVRFDGTPVHVALSASPAVYDEKPAIQTVFVDVTDRKRAQEALAASEEQFRLLFESARDAIFWADAETGVLINCNRAAEDLVERPRAEIIGRPQAVLHPPEEAEIYAERFKNHVKSRGAVDNEVDVIAKSGIRKPVRVSAAVTTIAGKPIIQGIFRDISERKRAEEALRESEERYRALMDNIPVGIYRNTPGPRGRFLLANPAIAHMFGCETVEEFLQRSVAELYADPTERKAFSDKLLDRGELIGEELRLKRKDSTPIWGAVTARVRRDASGEIVWFDGMIEDITERKRAEEALRESEAKYRVLLQHIPGMVYRGAPDWSAEIVSDSEPICGYESEELNSRRLNWLDILHPDDRARVLAEGSQLVKEKTSLVQEYRIIAKNGSVRWVSDHKTSFFSEDGEFLGIDGIVYDITERRRAQEAIHRQAAALEQSISGIAVSDLDGNLEFVNRAFAEMHGYRPEELPGKDLSLFHTEEQMERDVIPFNDILRERGQHSGEVEHIRRDGTPFPTWMSCSILTDTEGAPVGMIGTAEDITERKRAEEELRFLGQITEQVSDCCIATDMEYRIAYVNRACEVLYGYSRKELVGRSAGMLNAEPDSAEIQSDIYQTVSSGQVWRGELQNRKKDGSTFGCEMAVFPLVDERGDIFAYACILRDITERKRAEDALRESEERYRRLVDMSPDAIGVVAGGKIAFMNPAGAALIAGDRNADVVGWEFLDLIHRDDRRVVANRMRQTPAGQDVDYPVEEKVVRPDGTEVDIELSAVPFQVGDETRAQVMFRDITEKKRARTALRRYADRLGAVHQLDRAILAREPVHDIASCALKHIRRIVPCVRASLVEFVEATGYATILAADPTGGADLQRDARVPLEHFGDIDKLKQGQVRFMKDTAAEAATSSVFAQLRDEGVNACINVPLIAGGELIGALNVGAESLDAFEGQSAAVIRELADTVAVAIRNARLDEQVRRHAAELEERVKDRTMELEAFSYSVSHDLQTPLRAIDGFSAMLLDDYAHRLDDEGVRRLDIIRASIKGMKQLIDDLLRFYRLGRQQMQHSRIDMDALVRDVVAGLPGRAGRDTQFEVEPLAPAYGDAPMIRQVLQNLLSNAVKFSRSRQTPRVRVLCREREKGNVYCLEDNGVGFDMRYAGKLFRVFERLHASSEFEGTGAGLAIVKRIVERHGGRVWAKGQVDRGASFSFYLPRQETHNGECADTRGGVD